MYSDWLHPAAHDGRGKHGHGEQVAGDGGHAHAQHEGRQAGHGQQQIDVPSGQIAQFVGKILSRAGDGHGSHQDADGRAQRNDHDHAFRRTFQNFEKPSSRQTGGRRKRRTHNKRAEGIEDAAFRRPLQHAHADDQHGKGRDVVPALTQHVAHAGQVFPRLAACPQTQGLDVHLNEQRAVIQHGGQKGGGAYRPVADAQKVRHKEGCGSHDRRGEHAPGGGHGFHRARKFRGESALFHHGNGDLPGGGHVGGHGAGQGAEEHAGQHGGFGRPPAVRAQTGAGQIAEEIARSGGLKYAPEQDEARHGGGRHGDDAAPVALAAEEHPACGSGVGEARAHEEAGEEIAVHEVEERAQGEDHRREARGAAHRFHQGCGEASGQDHLPPVGVAPLVDERVGVPDDIAAGGQCPYDQHRLENGTEGAVLMPLAGGHDQQREADQSSGADRPVRHGIDDYAQQKEYLAQRQDDVDGPQCAQTERQFLTCAPVFPEPEG